MSKILQMPFTGDYSRDIFSERKKYIGALLQQGKKLIDADMNDEIQERIIRLQRIVSSAFPAQAYGDSFKLVQRVSPGDRSNDFLILARTELGSPAAATNPESYARMYLGGLGAILSNADSNEGVPFGYVGGGTGIEYLFGEIHHRSTDLTATVLTDTNARFVPNELIGMYVIPNTVDGTEFQIASNTETTITIVSGSMLTVGAGGDFYRVRPVAPGIVPLYAITAFADAGGGLVTVTAAGHGFVDGDTVTITGTTNYNGDFVVSNVVAGATFDIEATWAGDDATGNVILAYPGRRDLVFLDIYIGEMTGDEDTDLLHPLGAGYESARRMVVRQQIMVRQNDTLGGLLNPNYTSPGLPWVADPTALEGYYQDNNGQMHYLVKLAEIARQSGVSDITDSITVGVQTIEGIVDLRDPWFGSSREVVAARRGFDSLEESIEDAIDQGDRYSAAPTQATKAFSGNNTVNLTGNVYVGESPSDNIAYSAKIYDANGENPVRADAASVISTLSSYFLSSDDLDISVNGGPIVSLTGLTATGLTNLVNYFNTTIFPGEPDLAGKVQAVALQGRYFALKSLVSGYTSEIHLYAGSSALPKLFGTSQYFNPGDQFNDGANGLVTNGQREPKVKEIGSDNVTWGSNSVIGAPTQDPTRFYPNPWFAFDAIIPAGSYIVRYGVRTAFVDEPSNRFLRRDMYPGLTQYDRRLEVEHYYDGQHRDIFLKERMIDLGILAGQVNAETFRLEADITSFNGVALYTVGFADVTTIEGMLALLVPKGGGVMTGILRMGDVIDMQGNYINDVADPVLDTDAANKGYVDSVAEGLNIKDACRCATTGPVIIASELEAGDIIDGYTLVAGDRILVKDQANPDQKENGIWVAQASGAAQRPSDWDSSTPNTSGSFVYIEDGTTNGNTGWVMNTPGDPIVDSAATTWVQFAGAGTYTAGAGLDLTGTVFSVKLPALSGLSASIPSGLSVQIGAVGGPAAGLFIDAGGLHIPSSFAGQGLVGGSGFAFALDLDGAGGATNNYGLQIVSNQLRVRAGNNIYFDPTDNYAIAVSNAISDATSTGTVTTNHTRGVFCSFDGEASQVRSAVIACEEMALPDGGVGEQNNACMASEGNGGAYAVKDSALIATAGACSIVGFTLPPLFIPTDIRARHCTVIGCLSSSIIAGTATANLEINRGSIIASDTCQMAGTVAGIEDSLIAASNTSDMTPAVADALIFTSAIIATASCTMAPETETVPLRRSVIIASQLCETKRGDELFTAAGFESDFGDVSGGTPQHCAMVAVNNCTVNIDESTVLQSAIIGSINCDIGNAGVSGGQIADCAIVACRNDANIYTPTVNTARASGMFACDGGAIVTAGSTATGTSIISSESCVNSADYCCLVASSFYVPVNAPLQGNPNFTLQGGSGGVGRWLCSSRDGIMYTNTTPGFISGGIDYAEMFESADGNPIAVGFLTTFDETDTEKIRKATAADDFLLGPVSSSPGFLCGDESFEWHGKYKRDDFGRILTEVVPNDQWTPDIEAGETEDDRPNITVGQIADAYDPEMEYQPRTLRSEWNMIGLVGQVRVRCDATLAAGNWIKSDDSGYATPSVDRGMGWRCMKIEVPFDAETGYGIATILIR